MNRVLDPLKKYRIPSAGLTITSDKGVDRIRLVAAPDGKIDMLTERRGYLGQTSGAELKRFITELDEVLNYFNEKGVKNEGNG